MKLPVDWLREFVSVPADAAAIAARLGSCGFAVESIDGDVIDFEITANRPDCLSVYGLAREAAVAFEAPLGPMPGGDHAFDAGPAAIKVSVADADCRRYAVALVDVTVGPSPEWLAARLRAAGVRPINRIVDVTNYVMLEIGQPMHAFDVSTLSGPEIRVRRARAGETLATLDGESRTLDASMLVIADSERAIAVAGVMGGAASEVSSATTRIALESACFAPETVRATSRKLGLKTEASARFERGADIAAPVTGIARALALFDRIGAGGIVGGVTDVYPRPASGRQIGLRRSHVTRLLGATIPDETIERILRDLGFALTAAPDGWRVDVPTFRVDVSREADLIEEVGRHWGFDRIPMTFPALSAPPRASDAGVVRGRLVRRLLCGAGLQEAVTFTFIEDAAAAPFAADDDRVGIKNPLSEKFAALRPSIVPGLADALAYNLNRQEADVRLFELGTIFSARHGERTAVAWAMTGSRGDHWSGSAGALDFSDTKGIADLVASALGVQVAAETGDGLTWLTEGQRAWLVAPNGARAGWIGRLRSLKGVDEPIYVGEIDLDALASFVMDRPAAIAPLPRFPSIVRDLSILVDERLPAAEVRGTIRSNAPATLVDVHEFDRYQGKGVPQGRISLSIRLTFRDAGRTLTDAEVQPAMETIVQALARQHGATLRGA